MNAPVSFSLALTAYQQAYDAINAGDPDDKALGDAYIDAFKKLVDARPRSASDFARKFYALWRDDGAPVKYTVDAMLKEAALFVGGETDTPISVAFADWTAGYRASRALPADAKEDVYLPIWNKIETQRDAILAAPVLTLQDAATKLRVGLMCLEQSWDDESIITGVEPDDELADGAEGYRAIYSVIRDLERGL